MNDDHRHFPNADLSLTKVWNKNFHMNSQASREVIYIRYVFTVSEIIIMEDAHASKR